MARRRLRRHRPTDGAATGAPVPARLRGRGRPVAPRDRTRWHAPHDRPRRVRRAQQGARHAGWRRGPRPDRRAAPGRRPNHRPCRAAGWRRARDGVPRANSTPPPRLGSPRGVEQAIRQPIGTSAGTVAVGVSIGALVFRSDPATPPAKTLMDWADREMQIQKTAAARGPNPQGRPVSPLRLRSRPPERRSPTAMDRRGDKRAVGLACRARGDAAGGLGVRDGRLRLGGTADQLRRTAGISARWACRRARRRGAGRPRTARDRTARCPPTSRPRPGSARPSRARSRATS